MGDDGDITTAQGAGSPGLTRWPAILDSSAEVGKPTDLDQDFRQVVIGDQDGEVVGPGEIDTLLVEDEITEGVGEAAFDRLFHESEFSTCELDAIEVEIDVGVGRRGGGKTEEDD